MNTDLCVIFNPAAGKNQAAARLRRLGRLWGDHARFLPTTSPGHAVALARDAALQGCGMVVAAGGDGTVHEVANGLLLSGRDDVRFGILPLGSANDYLASVRFETDLDGTAAAPFHTVDVARVRSPDGRSKFFVCCLGLGLNGRVTLESRKIRRLQGIALYGLATLRALWYHYGIPEMTVAFDDQPAATLPTLMLSVLVGRREGGFVMAPDARLDDGRLDYVHSGGLTRWEVLRLLPKLALSGPPSSHPKIRQGRCRKVRLTSTVPLVVHIDGEFFCRPEDDVRTLEVDILPQRLRIAPLPRI